MKRFHFSKLSVMNGLREEFMSDRQRNIVGCLPDFEISELRQFSVSQSLLNHFYAIHECRPFLSINPRNTSHYRVLDINTKRIDEVICTFGRAQ